MAACIAIGADDDNATLTLRPAANAVGRVIGPDAQPGAKYTVSCIMRMGGETWARTSTYSDVGGIFTLSGLPQGVSCQLIICDAMRCGVKPAKEFTVQSPATIELGSVTPPKEEK